MLFLIGMLLFGSWLVAHVYFPRLLGPRLADATGKQTSTLPPPVFFEDEEGLFGPMMRVHHPRPPHHFHMTDPEFTVHVEHPEGGLSLCAECHGVYAHYVEEKSRGLLNLHGSFMDCAVCHLGLQEGQDHLSLAWVDNETGAVSKTVAGRFGKYPAKLYPVMEKLGGEHEVLHPITQGAATRYLKLRPTLTTEQNSVERKQLHERLSDEPISCPQCHNRDGVFDFVALGFSPARAADLTSSEVARMIDEYEVFYMPSFLQGQ